MDRRTFLKATTVTAGSGLALQGTPVLAATEEEPAAPAVARVRKTLIFGAAWSDDVPVFADAARRLALRVQQVLGDDFRIIQTSEAGSKPDMTFGCQPIGIASAFLEGLSGSYALSPMQHQAWLSIGGGQLLWDDLAAQHGWKPLLAGHTGPQPGLWTTFDLQETSSLAGKRLFVSGSLGRRLVHQLGAEFAEAPPPELANQLTTDQLAAIEWGNPVAALMLGLPDAATHFYRGGIYREGVALALNVRLPVWESLSPSAQAAIEGLAAEQMNLALSESMIHGRLAAQSIEATPSIMVTDLPARLSTEIDRVTDQLINEIALSFPEARRIRDSYLNFRRMLGSEPDARALT